MIMPGMEINKVLAWLRKINPKVKIIASSGMAEKVNIDAGFQRNVAGYIHKPFQVRPLLTTVRSILNA
jgi:DNA-binding response OmpR family regulator